MKPEHKSTLIAPILGQMNAVYIVIYSYKIYF
jgi:hypothetical protein